MNFQLSEEQQAIVDAVGKLLDRHAGPDRARQHAAEQSYDHQLDAALADAGFVDGDGMGPLEAALVLETIARGAGVVAYGAAALVVSGLIAAGVVHERPPGPIALVDARDDGPVRYGAHARTLLIADGDHVRVRPSSTEQTEPVSSLFGFPMARVARDGGERSAAGSADCMRAWWRVALAAETAGTMRAALDFTVDYVKQREQFGRPIGSFQALQHRLAEATVLVEGCRFLTYEAAWRGEPQQAAVAAAHAAAVARRVFCEVHQQNGAIGFTREHDLHVWSMRLQTLRLELRGVAAHRRAVAQTRWNLEV